MEPSQLETTLKLEVALYLSYSKETSSDPDNWSPQNPTWGQCAVTALIVNDYLGGKIVWANVALNDGRNISHYFNNINDEELDLTRTQFPKGTIVPEGTDKTKGLPTTRDYVLSYQPTKERYQILKQKVKKILISNK